MLTDLGLLPGGYSRSYGYAVNNSGFVAGRSDGMITGSAAHIYLGSGPLVALTSGGWAAAWSINGQGVAVGEAGSSPEFAMPVRWQSGAQTGYMTPIDAVRGAAYGINNLGVAVGYTQGGPGSPNRATMFTDLGFSLLPIPLGALGDSQAYDINSTGVIVGSWGNRAFVSTGGNSSFLATPDGARSWARSISDDGTATGFILRGQGLPGEQTGAVWRSGQLTEVSFGVWTELRGASAEGVAIGTYVTRSACPLCGFAGDDFRAMIWSDDFGAVDLNDLTINLDGWTLQNGLAISENGFIAGSMFKIVEGRAREHAFLLAPVAAAVPSPTPVSLLLLSAPILFATRARVSSSSRKAASDYLGGALAERAT